LNVATDAVWACYWDNYPVVRIAPDDSIAWWTSPRKAPGALAVNDRWFAMYLSYGDCALLELDEYRLLERELVKLVLPSGTPLETQRLIGRGSFLHLFDGPHWYRIDVETIRDN
jgi:hypothetical protein